MMIILSLSIAGCGKPEEITKEQMLLAQIQYSEYLSPITELMADVYSEYIAYNISEKKFKTEIKNCLKLIETIEKQYAEFNKRYVLAQEESSEDIRRAVVSMEKVRQGVKLILEKSVVQGRVLERKALLKLYMEGFEEIQTYLDEFKKITNTILETEMGEE